MGIADEKISHDQGITNYRVKVHSFEQKMSQWKPGRIIHLKTFCVNGVELRLEVYPNGETNKTRDFTSIYIANLSNDDIKITFDLTRAKI